MSNVVNLGERRPDVHWTVHITQGWDGHLEVFVEDISDDLESRKRAAAALRRAAEAIEHGEPST
ncbi:hypothetical protein C7441_11028 [Pseudaminobacter salicylatoxidans]|uniref:Uncharacterized protein n=1 Tax=Pseudaminobacter salicylatoxidans TaxID=93369 RepID=A0A316C0F8_PSESE|nr:hypothetical protein [Pseudaminobacter salicylatoxidans]PWJ81496.1 hypothetical protein C7441_11028 [Pseudaminobacter salicylatoxidans]